MSPGPEVAWPLYRSAAGQPLAFLFLLLPSPSPSLLLRVHDPPQGKKIICKFLKDYFSEQIWFIGVHGKGDILVLNRTVRWFRIG